MSRVLKRCDPSGTSRPDVRSQPTAPLRDPALQATAEAPLHQPSGTECNSPLSCCPQAEPGAIPEDAGTCWLQTDWSRQQGLPPNVHLERGVQGSQDGVRSIAPFRYART